LARLDERLARSPVRDGSVERQHFADAAAALWLVGELVHVEDLVLHDAHMDIRTPTHELTRAHAVLRTRRRILSQKPDWALGREGFLALTGRGGAMPAAEGQKNREGQGAGTSVVEADGRDDVEDDLLAEEFAEIDAVLARSSKILSGADVPARTPRWDERPNLITISTGMKKNGGPNGGPSSRKRGSCRRCCARQSCSKPGRTSKYCSMPPG
jgi:hypothetical protein